MIIFGPKKQKSVKFALTSPRSKHLQSLDIPTIKHFLKRHCWQRFLLILMMGQLSFLRHFLYWMFCWMLLLKKPCVFTKIDGTCCDDDVSKLDGLEFQ